MSRRFFVLTSATLRPHLVQRPSWLRRLGWILLLGLVMGSGILYWSEPPATAFATAPTAVVQRGPLEITVSEKGETVSPNAVEVRCDLQQLSGQLQPVVPDGARVAKGQVIARYDVSALEKLSAEQEEKTRTATAALRAAQEELTTQEYKATTDVAKAQMTLRFALLDQEKYLEGEYKVELEERQRAVAMATRELEDAQERLEHYRTFLKKGFGTREHLKVRELEATRARYTLLREQGKLMILEKYAHKRQQAELAARIEQARRELLRTQETSTLAVAKAREALAAAEKNLRQEQGRLQCCRQRLAQPMVAAPAAGMILYERDPAASPTQGCRSCKVVDPEQLQVSIKLPARKARRMRPGQKATIHLPHTERQLTGRVRAIAPDSSAAGEPCYTTTVAIEAPPQDVTLKPGLPAEVEVVVEQIPNAVTLPRAAVVAKENQHFALVLGGNGYELRPIAIGQQTERQLEVRAGLQPGEQVVLDAQERLGELRP
jgi:HlyD family secretion protein